MKRAGDRQGVPENSKEIFRVTVLYVKSTKLGNPPWVEASQTTRHNAVKILYVHTWRSSQQDAHEIPLPLLVASVGRGRTVLLGTAPTRCAHFWSPEFVNGIPMQQEEVPGTHYQSDVDFCVLMMYIHIYTHR